MQHLCDLSQLKLEECELTIGSFDGVHIGHQAIIRPMVDQAHRLHRPAVVLTFYPHPSTVLRGNGHGFYLTLPEEKARVMATLGIDFLVTQRFDPKLSHMRAESFLDRLQAQLSFHGLWAGEDFTFGYQREGTSRTLKAVSQTRDFQLHIVSPIIVHGAVVSSTRIRTALMEGDVSTATELLGRPYRTSGKVEVGAGRGRELGFPTANLSINPLRVYPGTGVYACIARYAEKTWMAVTNVGFRPTFEKRASTPVLETHLLDFQGELYDEEIELDFMRRLRSERHFSHAEALMEQIQHDIDQARKLLQLEVQGSHDQGLDAQDLPIGSSEVEP